MSIILFSRPVRSGKTTELMLWCDQHKDAQGILMPDNGNRKIMNVRTKELFDIECADPSKTKDPLISVGKYFFYTEAFEKANSILLEALAQKPSWLIIDEAGKLELDGKGFYPAIEKIIPLYKISGEGNLLITVRDSLVEKFVEQFDIRDHSLINSLAGLK